MMRSKRDPAGSNFPFFLLERLFSWLREDSDSSWGEESNGASHMKQLEYQTAPLSRQETLSQRELRRRTVGQKTASRGYLANFNTTDELRRRENRDQRRRRSFCTVVALPSRVPGVDIP